MVMQRWGSLMLLLIIVLSACGASQTADVAVRDTGIAPTITPDGPYPLAVNEQLQATATGVPTVEAPTDPVADPRTRAIAPPTTLNSIQILSKKEIYIDKRYQPSYPIAWADKNTLFYGVRVSQGKVSPFEIDLVRLDPETEQFHVIAEHVASGTNINDQSYIKYSSPVLEDACCSLLVAYPIDQATHRLTQLDFAGNQHGISLITAPGPFFTDPQLELPLIAHTAGMSLQNSLIAIPAFQDKVVQATLVYKNGVFAYADHDSIVIQDRNASGNVIVDIPTLKDVSLFPELYSSDYDPYREIRSLEWSTDGEQLAFFVRAGQSFELWVMDKNGAHPVSFGVTHGAYADFLAWSPDSSLIAYTATPPQVLGDILNVIDLSTRDITYIDTQVSLYPVWLPKSHTLAIIGYYGTRENSLKIFELEE